LARIDYYRTPVIETLGYSSDTAQQLRRVWETAPGIYGWLATVDHKTIGIRYIVTAFFFWPWAEWKRSSFVFSLRSPTNTCLRPSNTISSLPCTGSP